MPTFIIRLGEYGYLIWCVILNIRYSFRDSRRIFYQMEHIGVNSIPLVLLVGFFSGSIIAWQGAYQIKGLAPMSVLGGQATRVIAMEIGPILTALIIAGRIGASLTAEIGSMKITEQIDALRTLSIDPVRYIVLPRFLGLMLMTPPLTLFANVMGVLGAYIIMRNFLGISGEVFFDSVKSFFEMKDLYAGLIKGSIFGFLIATIGCFVGMSASGGSEGVGKATIYSYVYTSLAILIADYFLWLILF